ncbi:MAG: acylphosphatase [Candidatus Magasanikbacteria bacterium]
MKKHYNITVKGKVQGVFYRKNTQKQARNLGLSGYVKNMANGTVKIEAEGEESRLKKLVEWCKDGPKRAKVDEVEVNEKETLKDYDKFRIKY